MRKLIVGFASSLDGFIEGPNGEIDWIIYDKEQQKEVADSWKDIDTMFLGRKTYEVSLAMQQQSKEPDSSFANMKHYVFSQNLQSVAEGYTLIRGNAEEEVQRIKNEKGKNIAVFGGSGLTCSLLNSGMVDELELAIMPVVLGAGKPFFVSIDQKIQLTLSYCKNFSSGVVRLVYEVKKLNGAV